MQNDGGNVADAGVCVPPEGVVQCEGIPRKSWMTKCVALQNDASVFVGKGICHNVDSALIIDSDNQPLGDDRVAVQIAKSLLKRDVPSNWVIKLRAWHISRIFLNGASLYNHEQMHLFRVSSRALRRQSAVGARPYESSRGWRNYDRVPKKEALLTVEMSPQCLAVQRTACNAFPVKGLRLYSPKCMSKGVYIIGSIDS